MTGTSLSIVTENNSQSYNTAVNTINLHQKDNVRKLENALHNANNNNAALLASLNVINENIKNCKKQVFVNNVRKLENALHNANNNNAALLASLNVINENIKNCKKQVFVNNALIVNWNKDAPFTYNIELLD